jgi:DNA-binding NtrC family response regulator
MANAEAVVLPGWKNRIPTILLVKDEVLIRMALASLLQDCGYAVLECSNAAEAIEAITTREFEIDVVFTDLQMPGTLDGFGLARWVQDHRPELPVLITTGDPDIAHTAAELCTKTPIVPKPHVSELVLARIRAAITPPMQKHRDD